MNSLPPISTQFTTCIASREFEVQCGDVIKKITIEIGLPVNDVITLGANAWRCPVHISYGKIVDDLHVCGEDSYQAIGLAFHLVQCELIKKTEQGMKLSLFGAPYVPFETNYEAMKFL